MHAWLVDPSGRRSPRWWRRHSPTTSQFALQHLIAYLHPAAGGFTVDLPVSPELAELLRGTGRTSINLGDQVLIEDNDLIIMAGKSLWAPEEETDITVQVEIGASRAGSIPGLFSTSPAGVEDSVTALSSTRTIHDLLVPAP